MIGFIRRQGSFITPSKAIQLRAISSSLPSFSQASEEAGPQKLWPKPLRPKSHGIDLLHDPLWNKGTAFDAKERDRLGIRGLLPPAVRTIEEQLSRVLAHIRKEPDDVAKNIYLQDLHNRNETLYHRILVDYIDEMAPLIYTPTVGKVCQQFGSQFRRSRGMYFTRDDRGYMSSMIYNWPHDDVHVVVVTDGSRILGLGDLGAHGMGIPIGKLALYCAAGGIPPHRVLPVMLDVGTNNETLLEDPHYIGTRARRLQGQEYYDMVDEFIAAVFGRWPGVVVQFEDFETAKAVPILEKYRYTHRVFNDDIQGTGCVTLAGVLAAIRNADSSLHETRIMCAGAGSAGLGVCSQLYAGMIESGMSPEDARKRFVVISKEGAFGRKDGKHGDPHYPSMITEQTSPWVNESVSDGASMLDVMKSHKPTVLLGLSAQGGIFTEELIRCMAQHTNRPIIMPMSNPTSKAECTPEQAYKWTDGKAVVATGSPFGPVTLDSGKTIIPSQCNNMYVFPGIGLAASIAGVSIITDKMLYEAALAIPKAMTKEEIAEGRTFPNIKRIREVSHLVAVAVIEEAIKEGLTTKITEKHKQNIPGLVKRKMYDPHYVPLVHQHLY